MSSPGEYLLDTIGDLLPSIRKRPDITITVHLKPLHNVVDHAFWTRLETACREGKPDLFPVTFTGKYLESKELIYGYILNCHTEEMWDGIWKTTYTLRPAGKFQEDCTKNHELPSYWFYNKNYELHTVEMQHKEQTNMKIYEAIIVKLDQDQNPGQPVEIVKVVTPFLAASEQAAKDAVLIDWARMDGSSVSGKDLAGYQVRVREFRG